MALARRHSLKLLASAGLAALWPHAPRLHAQTEARTAAGWRYLNARKRDGRFETALIDARGGDLRVIAMPARGHSFALDAHHQRAVVFGRQAGFFAIAFNLTGAAAPQRLAPAANRHFYGHGVYLNQGRLLVATENDYDHGRGVLAVYDAADAYRRIREYDSGGTGPHEVIVMPDGRTLCVANGGILTHPDYGKLALNLADMVPSLAYIDAHTGTLLDQYTLPPDLHRLSIRHLTLDASGAVWFGCQYQGPASDAPPLVGRHRRGQPLALFSAPDIVQRGLKNYIGSISTDASGRIIATSSPLGGCVAWWDASTGRSLGATSLFDGCGVAPAAVAGRFLLTGGQGHVVCAGPTVAPQALRDPTPVLAWDNHCRVVASLAG